MTTASRWGVLRQAPSTVANGFLIARSVLCVAANLTTNELLRAPHFGCAIAAGIFALSTFLIVAVRPGLLSLSGFSQRDQHAHSFFEWTCIFTERKQQLPLRQNSRMQTPMDFNSNFHSRVSTAVTVCVTVVVTWTAEC